MDHLAIMNKNWRLIPKIVAGEKTIESRWYKARVAPWNRIQAGERVFFKDAGEPVTAAAEVAEVKQFEVLTGAETERLVREYGGSPGICFRSSLDEAVKWAKGRRYVILIFLKNARWVEPFSIDKTGFGNACAWLTVGNITEVRK